ncbi:MAG: metallophosphoesterase [Caldilineales bacterium]|nr:metallophosphoesterase [Caldilineales bacterium]
MRRKTKIVISDTHIGAGGKAEGNDLEDFISDAEFVDWIHALVDESNRDDLDMELIVNGDWIEFLQIPSVDIFEPHRHYDTEEYTDPRLAEALQRISVVHEWHPSIFLGLSDFLNPGPPRRTVTILFGNHDPELAYPEVQNRIRQMVNAVGQDADLVSFPGRTQFEHGVLIEHGNAYVEEVNQFSDPDHPFDPEKPDTVERPPGSLFVTNYFNHVEWERPWIDGVHPITTLILYALAFEPSFALDALAALLKAAPGLLRGIAGAPEADQSAPTRDQLITELATAEQRLQLAARMNVDPAYAAEFAGQVAQAFAEVGAAPPADALPGGVAGSPGASDPVLRAKEITEHYWQVMEDKAGEIAREMGAQVVLFGHIHEAIDKRLPNGAKYINTGTWVWKGNFKDAPEAVWRDLLTNPDKYANERDLRYARVDIDESGRISRAKLLRAGEEPIPPEPPEPQPAPGFWARFVLAISNFFKKLFG